MSETSVPATAATDGLAITDVRAGYGETMVLNGISLAVAPGSTLAILGRNGVGKTTLLSTIMGRSTLHGGTITFNGRDIGQLSIYRRSDLGVALVPQEREIFKSLSVEENLSVAARAGKWDHAAVYEFFPSLAKRRQSRGDQLSGGEQQMLALGRALMGNPKLLLLDEPLEGLAPVIVDRLLEGIERLRAAGDLGIILVEQHARLALAFSETAMVLDRGAVVFQGASAELASNPDLMSTLLGIKRGAHG